MTYRFTQCHVPATLDGLTDAERAQLPVAVKRLFGEELPLEDAFACEDYGPSAHVWRVLDDDGKHVYDLWADGSLWMDCCLFAAGTPELVPVVMIQHGFQALDPAYEPIVTALSEGTRDGA